jgi:pimeloyl-ACP methyl ester carboxylesterase
MIRVVRAAAVLTSAAAVFLVAAAPADAVLRFKRCGSFGFACSRLSVPLDHSGVVPGRVSLHIKRIRALERPRRGAVFVLAGGPGQSNTASFTGDAIGILSAAFRHRDLIVFDQRGTGRSGLLRCPAIERSSLLDAGAAAGACARRLGARRAFYTSRDSVDDIEAIRRELGVPRIALFGTSYGTKVALGYALRYPANVERLALDSVVEAGGPSALYLDTFAAVPRALRALCRSGCRGFTRSAVADIAALVARMAAGPVRGRLVDSHGRRRRVTMGHSHLFAILLTGDVDPGLRAELPGAVRAALDGDAAPILRLRRRAFTLEGLPPPPRLLSSALYTATTCEETALPWARTTPPLMTERRSQAAATAASLPDSAFFPFDRATAMDTDLLELCDRWPAAPVAPALGEGPLPDVPVLLLGGEDDLRTPIESARRVALQFPRAALVEVPATGHSVLGADTSGCAMRAFARFFRGTAVPTRCARLRRAVPVSPPPPTSLREVAPLRGVRGRTLAAVWLTLRDVAEDSVTQVIVDEHDADLARGGGLRGGSYRIRGRGTLVLRGVSFVPGVRLRGKVARFATRRQRGRIRVSGPAGPDGLLAVRGTRLRGRLGGRRVRARFRSGAMAARASQASAHPIPLAGPG